jgi:hypothetical protein
MANETVKVERPTEKKSRKARVPKLNLTPDANLNTKLVAEDALLVAKIAYKRLMQICNGKKIRGTKEKGNYKEFPLQAMSDARRKYYEDQFAALHSTAFSALEHGRKMEAVSVNVPD